MAKKIATLIYLDADLREWLLAKSEGMAEFTRKVLREAMELENLEKETENERQDS